MIPSSSDVPGFSRAQLEALDRTISTLTLRLLERRHEAGHWEGRLSSSALSTATAMIALLQAEGATGRDHGARVRGGMRWLAANQNQDGGWGDTVLSSSNLSTTALCWAALSMVADLSCAASLPPSHEASADRHSLGGGGQAGRGPAEAGQHIRPFLERAESWLHSHVGDLRADRLSDAIIARYGKDRTFSVPILTVLAIAGRLESWRCVPQLPFELAAFPHRMFRWLRLPVVSYAVPALVAIGQVRHRHAPTRNPALRVLRSALRRRTLRKLRQMQPDSGGYLEATPLTAFVVMSLISAGESNHPVVEHGVRFLAASARSDGSWPIDTNLATWVTTLAIDNLASLKAGSTPDVEAGSTLGVLPGFSRAGDVLPGFGRADCDRLVEWLLAQQLREEHPFTHADPGGWAWTDLSGGVPDADDTAGALVALWNLAGPELRVRAAAEAGIEWLLGVQNRDGGIPTFCRGWGALPFDRSAPDLTAHAIEAWSAWHDTLDRDLGARVSTAARHAIACLSNCQSADGSWSPLWFGNEHVEGETNPVYGTSRVVTGLAATLARDSPDAQRSRRRAVAWLLGAQNTDGGWGGGPGAPSSIEETGLALRALGCDVSGRAGLGPPGGGGAPPLNNGAGQHSGEAVARGVRWLIAATDEGRRTPASPIGLYFARLWYFEETYPILFSLAGLLEVRKALMAGREGPIYCRPETTT